MDADFGLGCDTALALIRVYLRLSRHSEAAAD
jgi:hypothetical protein